MESGASRVGKSANSVFFWKFVGLLPNGTPVSDRATPDGRSPANETTVLVGSVNNVPTLRLAPRTLSEPVTLPLRMTENVPGMMAASEEASAWLRT